MHSKRDYTCKLVLSNIKEAKNSPTDREEVNPQTLDQSYNDPKKTSMILATGVS